MNRTSHRGLVVPSQNKERIGSHKLVAEDGESNFDREVSTIRKITYEIVPIFGNYH